MKACSYCGRQNVEDAIHCRECGSEFERPGEFAPAAKPKRERPIGTEPVLGWLSAGAPFIGAFVVYFGFYIMDFGYALLAVPMAPIFGITCAAGAWNRGERYLALRWLGLLFALIIIGMIISTLARFLTSC